MKTYLFDTFHRYKRFSEELDAKTILCNKSWWVFNDSGEKEVYIFNTDGTLIIAVSGKVTNATWQYITANKSLIISGNNQSYMVKPAFYDNQIFALQVDGTNDYAFLIDENNLPSTNLRSLADLKEHFAEKERQAVLAEERKRQAAIEAQRQREIKIKEEQRIYEINRQKLKYEEKEKREKDRILSIYRNIDNKVAKFIPWWFPLSTVGLISIGFNYFDDIFLNSEWHSFLYDSIGLWVILVGLIEFVTSIIIVEYFPPIIYYLILVYIYKLRNPDDINAIQYLLKHIL